ncbi:E3 ubiquitin-protein ligase TRIM71-like [Magallana gigas]|uniref:E3 ubiquitin-protein ligase TRIM71-like n=1 Tax=Magallana gigas TaxID=29159 RepID=UPI00333F8894
MASESQIPPDAQHYLVCGTEGCERNCQFYCNDCHQQMCEQCRDEHQKNKKTNSHDVVPYKQRKRQIPVEKCQIHPTKKMVLLCEECQIPICYKCTATKEHRGHAFTDLEIDFDEKVSLCHEEIAKIRNYFEPTSRDLKKEIAGDVTEIKKIMDVIRTSMKAEAESLKKLVDTVTSDKIKQVDKIEQSLLETLNGQNQKIDVYINYLSDLITTFYSYLSPSNIKQITLALKSESFIIRPIPETSKPVPPVFTAGNFNKEDVTKLLGRITVQNTKPENRKIKPMETASTQLKPTGKQRKQGREKSGVKQTLSLSSSVTKVREYTVPGVDDVYHISLGKSGRLWVSDIDGNLVQTDLQGNQLQKIQTSGLRNEGFHTITQDGDLIYTEKGKKAIYRLTPDNTITEFIKTGNWKPLSIHSSHINGDILVGMMTDKEAEVTRYNKTGTEIQNIQRDNKGQEMYCLPHYVTGNINGDVCVSDYDNAVVVVDKSGQNRFSYTGQGLRFNPFGICTDVLGHILVCGTNSQTVHLLDQDGHFLSLLLTKQQGMVKIYPCSLCTDDENNLWVGQSITNTVTVYKYLQ